jgi:molybdopterin molybdotransferase
MGRRLRSQDLGLCAALGVSRITVFQRPRIAIISTGDEVVEIEKVPAPGQVRDVNRYSLAGFCMERGAIPVPLGLCKDDFRQLSDRIAQGLEESDSVWISGGSSVGTRDLTLKVFESMGNFELLVHGISISPGKPTIMGLIDGKPVIGLPGHISSALVVAEVFLTRLIYRLCGLSMSEEEGICTLRARMSRNVESVSGRDDYIRVKLVKRDGDFIAEPIFGKSALISPLVEGDGLVRIHRNTEGLYEGDEVEVRLFSPLITLG